MTFEPTRLIDDPALSEGLRRDLDLASRAELSGFDRAAGLASLQSQIAAQTATAASSGSVLGKVVLGLVLTTAAAGGILASRERPSTPVEPTPTTDSSARQPLEPPTEPVGPIEVAPSIVPVPAVAPEGPAKVEAPVGKASRPARRRADAPVETDPELAPSVMEEAKLVARARNVLGSRPDQTLELVEEAVRRFPDGQLVEEREALRIRALAKLDRGDDARRAATKFLATYGSGAHADVVRRAVGL